MNSRLAGKTGFRDLPGGERGRRKTPLKQGLSVACARRMKRIQLQVYRQERVAIRFAREECLRKKARNEE